jgi:hypothetical protein
MTSSDKSLCVCVCVQESIEEKISDLKITLFQECCKITFVSPQIVSTVNV